MIGLDELGEIREREEQARPEQALHVCMAASCLSQRSDAVKDALLDEVQAQGASGRCQVKRVGCLGPCSAGPVVQAVGARGEALFQRVAPEDAAHVVRAALQGTPPPDRLHRRLDVPFFTRQQRIVTENLGRIDPERIEDYVAVDGYRALLEVVTSRKPADVCQEIQRSGLRGRGGAGYPSGLKWTTVAKAQGARKFVICNADEGDPGAFMDRSVLESDPHRVLEGMAIAGYAVGASQGYIYVRAEYPLAIARLRVAIKQAERLGVLGHSIHGTPFGFSVDLRMGAGAFVCGEETALIASIEGSRGQPRPRPPYPAESGLWDCPTLINNVETFANVPSIMRNGAAWYSAIGTDRSKGTKVFALAGKVENTGLIEVPMGMTLRQIVEEIGGGVPGGKAKAVQTGGPSGGCIPAPLLDMPVDYESLVQAGSIMGSGGMIVMDGSSCMVDVARYFLEFCKLESCGKCAPCRVGTVQLHDLVTRIARGQGQPQDLEKLERLSEVVKATSLCGLGQTAPNPLLSTLRYFRGEYAEHLEGRCPAGVCKLQGAGAAAADGTGAGGEARP